MLLSVQVLFVTRQTDRQPCIAAHPMDFFWKTWGRISLLVWCQGQTQDTAQPEINHDPAPTSTPTNRPLPRDSVCLVLSSTIPSFQSVPLGFFLQDATKSATSLNHHNRLNSPDYTTYLRVYKNCMYIDVLPCLRSHVQDKECLASLSKTSVVEIEHGLARPHWTDHVFHSWDFFPRHFSFHSSPSPPLWYCPQHVLG